MTAEIIDFEKVREIAKKKGWIDNVSEIEKHDGKGNFLCFVKDGSIITKRKGDFEEMISILSHIDFLMQQKEGEKCQK